MKGANKAHQPEGDQKKNVTSAAQMNKDPFHEQGTFHGGNAHVQ